MNNSPTGIDLSVPYKKKPKIYGRTPEEKKVSQDAYLAEYNIRNKAKIRARQRAWYLKNQERILAEAVVYREENKVHIAAVCKAYREKNKDKIRESKREYRRLNAAYIKAHKKAYAMANKEKISAKNKIKWWTNVEVNRANRRAYYWANREWLLPAMREKWQANREKHKVYRDKWRSDPENNAKHVACNMKWAQANPEKQQGYRAATKANRRSAEGVLTKEDVAAARAEGEGRCPYCICDLSQTKSHVDHVRPLARGGTNTRDNIVVCCARCNLKKNSKTVKEFVFGWKKGTEILPDTEPVRESEIPSEITPST